MAEKRALAPGTDVRACARAACSVLDESSAPHAHACARGANDVPAVLDEAARLFLLREHVADLVAYRPLLLEVAARAICRDPPAALHTLSLLLGAWEELLPAAEAALNACGPHADLDLLTQYRLARAAPNLCLPGAPAELYTLFADDQQDKTTRLLALEVYVLRKGLAPAARAALHDRWIGDAPAPLDAAPDVRLLPVYEAQRLEALAARCTVPLPDASDAPLPLTPTHLAPNLVLMEGVLLHAPQAAPAPGFVLTPGLRPGVQQAALHLGIRVPLLLTGPAACGKTHLASFLAHRLHGARDIPPLLTIQLGDQSGVDGKQLLGAYVSSTTAPGTFEWVEGALTRAVRLGIWVLLEDIDKASTDVLSVLAPLLDGLGPTKRVGARPTLDLGARGVLEAAPGFALLATRTQPGTFFTSEHWGEVVLPAPTSADVDAILTHRFPTLHTLPPEERAALVHAWSLVASASHAPTAPSGVRRTTLRELIKWCERVAAQRVSSVFAHPAVQESVLLDACDLFFAARPDAAPGVDLAPDAAALLEAVADALHISPERARWALGQRVPEWVRAAPRLGRVALPASAREAPATRYALTQPTLALLERVAACVAHAEPVLLVGETGTGKTSMVQHLARLYATPLTAINMSQQTESTDLLGAYKPLDPAAQARRLHDRWVALFTHTFSERRNAAFLDAERRALVQSKWGRLVKLWNESARMAAQARSDDGRKKRRVDTAQWDALTADVASFAALHAGARCHFVFSFVEGPLVQAVRNGHWILLDEINLAAPETLEALAMLLQSKTASVVLTERGDLTPVPRHPNFRLFACMNPATDVGKRDLAPAFRARFTELYVPSPDTDRAALESIVAQYIGEVAVGDRAAVLDVAEWYTAVRRQAQSHALADGCNERPHYSVRTLARALTFAAALVPQYGLRRALAEGVAMAFGMLLDAPSAAKLQRITEAHLLARAKDRRRLAPGFVPPRPGPAYVPVGAFWLATGPLPVDEAEAYVLTPSVTAKLQALARTLVTRQSPVLIQGPTSAGKTSAVEYLARRTGHRFVRINNHEHTDVQEYLGTYASDASGRLVYTEGLLVTALRRGDWIVLDELNLAPTDVLEALNRLLDDNRELLIPETGEVVRPHPHFMLFATQNPPGAYAGRKMLSRALRNRFVEVHFDDVPAAELATILTHRCRIAPSYASKIVDVFLELQRRRQAERVFENKHAATLRDLFRWGARGAVGYEQLADTGYMLLAERARSPRDRATVRAVLEEVLRVRLAPEHLYTLQPTSTVVAQIGTERAAKLRAAAQARGIVWTGAMQRLVCLAAVALTFDEPLLLVGETGAGKTSVCDILSDAFARPLHAFNCHQNTDSADLLGGQRPVRDRGARLAEARAAVAHLGLDTSAPLDALASAVHAHPPSPARDTAQARIAAAQALFVWNDGPLVVAMRRGDHMLLDEVSLADDSVLERLNSVLEKERTLVLAEKAGHAEELVLQAAPGFQVLATMNPGGDYGKKELSPALRNRFTEVYVPAVDDYEDQAAIVRAQWDAPELHAYTAPILAFCQFLARQLGGAEHTGLGVRDLLSWATFVRAMHATRTLTLPDAFAHGAALVAIDGLGTLPATASMSRAGLAALQARCWEEVARLVAPTPLAPASCTVRLTSTHVHVGPFALEKTPDAAPVPFALAAPTTAANALRVLRACAVPGRSVLLEGSPGAGKTSLIASLAALSGHALTRINLSEQTELLDLFGAELPVEGGRPGEFAWRPAAFLAAMQAGHWVLLDEMNLASQTVLEGLNACLDHRGTVYVPELGRTFARHPDFRVFAAQNPQHQGGARKGLPKSLLNRFTKVHVAELQAADALVICGELYPTMPQATLERIIAFNDALQQYVDHGGARNGAPWEFNLRDLLRWLALLHTPLGVPTRDPSAFFATLYAQRLRTPADRARAAALYTQHTGAPSAPLLATPHAQIGATDALVGTVHLARAPHAWPPRAGSTALPPSQLACLAPAAASIRMGWLTILTGAAGVGKTRFAALLADLAGAQLDTVRLSSTSDTMDLLGAFEQHDVRHAQQQHLDTVRAHMDAAEARARVQATPSTPTLLATLEAARTTLATDARAALATLAALDVWTMEEHAALVDARAALDARQSTGQFAWVDGPLVRAATRGHWLVLEHANLCSASVLDRLNSLFEPNGTLALSERGMVDGAIPELQAHPDFRVLMTVDARHGELSRAMRNRGMEVCLDAPASTHLAPMARCLAQDARSTPLASAVQAHAQRRGLVQALPDMPPDTPSDGIAPDFSLNLTRVGEEEAARVAHVLATLARTPYALTYAAQALPPAARRLLAPALSAAQRTCLEQALDGVAEAVRLRDAQLCEAGYAPRILALLPPDLRRLGLPDGEAIGHWIALRLGAAQEQHALHTLDGAAPTVLARAKQRAPDLAPDLAGLYTLLDTLAAFLVRFPHTPPPDVPATEHAALHTLLEATSFLRMACAAETADHSLVAVLLRVVRASLRDVRDTARVDAVLRTMHAPHTAAGGAALHALWAHLLPDTPPELWAAHARLDAAAHTVAPEPAARTACEVLATLLLADSSWSKEQQTELATLAAQLATTLAAPNAKAANCAGTLPEAPHDTAALARPHLATSLSVALWMLTVCPVQPLARDTRLRAFLRLGVAHLPPAALVAAQMQLWAPEAPRAHAAPLCLRAAAHALWAHHGAATLVHATFLRTTVQAVQHERVSLFVWPTYCAHLTALGETLAVALAPAETPRPTALHALLLALVAWVATCLADALRVACPEAAANAQALDAAAAHADMATLRAAVTQTHAALPPTAPLAAGLSRWLEAADAAVHAAPHADGTPHVPHALGAAWVALALHTLALYLPSVPLDPVAEAHAHHAFATFRIDRLQNALDVEHAAEKRWTGNAHNGVTDALHDALRTAMARRSAQHTHAPRTPDAARLARLHQELTAFAEQVLAPARLHALVAALGQGAPRADEQVDALQASLASFAHRLERQYVDLYDLVAPVRLVLDEVRLGLGLCAAPAPPRRAARMLQDASQFPAAAAAHALPKHAAANARELLAQLAAETYNARVVHVRASQRIAQLYDALYHVWAHERTRREADAAAASQLYTYRGTSDDEEAERLAEQRRLFPVYDEEWEATETHPASARVSSAASSLVLGEKQVYRIYTLHLALFAPDAPDAARPATVWDEERARLVTALGTTSALPSALDATSAALQLALLDARTAPRADHANFYHDPDPSTMAELAPILARLAERVAALHAALPEQVQLQQLHARCTRVAQLGMDSPVARALAAVEQLLTHVEDWETYASRATSLREHAAELTSLVVAWRKRELHEWQRLLDAEAEAENARVAPFFFSLYESLASIGDTPTPDALRALASVLDTYVRTSPVGQLAARVRLLEAFARFTDARLAPLVHGVAQSFAQFVPEVHAYLDKERSVLEREVHDYVRLATWRDVNVFALRQSAQKTHTYLHRTLRKFRTVLQEPAEDRLARAADARPAMAVRTLEGPGEAVWAALPALHVPTIPARPHAPPHLQHPARTLQQLHTLCTTTLFPHLRAVHIADEVRTLASDILATADDLAHETPAFATEANAKQIKSLASQKRRAWSELLRTLRRIGLQPFVAAEVRVENQDAAVVHGAPLFAPDEALGTEALVAYHAALHTQLARVRAAVHAPSGEVASAELQRALGSIEHGAHLATRLRTHLARFQQHASKVHAQHTRLAALCHAPALVTLENVDAFDVHADALLRIYTALQDMGTHGARCVRMLPLRGTVPDLAPLAHEAASLSIQLRAVADAVHATGLFLCSESEAALVESSAALYDRTHEALHDAGTAHPALTVLTQPTCAWLAQLPRMPLAPRTPPAGTADRLCSAVLVIAQALRDTPAPPNELVDRVLVDEAARLHTLERILRPEQVAAQVCALPGTLSCVREAEPFLAVYDRMLFAHTHNLSLLYRALARLELVVCTIVHTLATRGFCSPPEEDTQENDADAEGGEQLEGGTGLGDGSGAKDISDTLQDDEQMEELDNEGGGDQEETQGEDKARDTDQLDGDAQSVDGERGEEGEQEEQEEKSMEDEVGDVDPLDPDAVDEKLWGDEARDQPGESEAQGGAEDDREHAADGNDARDQPEQDQNADDEQNTADEKEEEAQDEPDAEVEDMPEKQQGLGREMDDEAKEQQEQQDMQLDDLDMDQGEESGASDNEEYNDGALSDPEPDAQRDAQPDATDPDLGEERPEHDEAEGEHDAEQAPESAPDADAEQAPEGEQDAEQPAEDSSEDPKADHPDAAQEPDAAPNEEEAEPQPDEPAEHGAPEPGVPRPMPLRPRPEQRTEQQTLGDATEANTETEGDGNDAGGAAGTMEQAVGGADEAGASAPESGGAAPTRGADALPDTTVAEDAEERANPTQSLGDSLEQFRRDIEAIRAASDAPADEAMPDAAEVEHIAHDQEADTQALGVASEQQAQAMQQLSVGDEESAPVADDTPDAPAPEPQPEAMDEGEDVDAGGGGGAGRPSERADGALSHNDVRAPGTDPAEETVDPLPAEERAEADEHVVQALAAFRASDGDESRAAELWHAYAMLTIDLAFGLCEQLRLILAPSLATRLNGDFRTGKRLNLRKIIPYIASDFAKDKIWLRRTKPSAREYQVLLSIDDSKSMAQGQNIHLAYQTLALVTGALMRLEVGDIAVCRFGKQVEMLHDFGAASFGDAHGGHILSRLRFDQTSTDVHALLGSTLEVLREARATRASASGADLWQLQIIISDGVCQDHEQLRAQIRRAMEERVMLVFVIVDAAEEGEKPSRSSILTMNQVSYHTDANGKLQLEMKRYIDTFPFDSYVIVRDVHALPGVLASTLRQWAETIRDA